jgi:hypothetical protein
MLLDAPRKPMCSARAQKRAKKAKPLPGEILRIKPTKKP